MRTPCIYIVLIYLLHLSFAYFSPHFLMNLLMTVLYMGPQQIYFRLIFTSEHIHFA